MINLIIKKPHNLKNDILSGLTVALALVPEAIAFSFVAHVDPVVGLYAAFMMGLITAIFGGRPGMISGATGAVAVIFAPLVIAQTQLNGQTTALNYLFLAVIIMGIIQIVFGLLKFGKFVRLIPHPVMLGFVNGLAIIIFKSQLQQFYVGQGSNAQLMDTVPLIVMIILIALTMFISQFLPKLTKAIPATLAAIVSVTGISLLLKQMNIKIYTVIDFVQNIDPNKTTIAASFPSFQLPIISLDAIKIVLPYAILAALVGLIESLMTLTLVDELTETRGKGNKESIGQGLANVVNGFFGGMGGCAMIGQSMINIRGGGRGRTSGIAAALFLLIFFMFGASLIENIPLAALVGVMFMVSIGTFEWSSFRILNKIPKSDAIIIILVSLTTVIFDLAIAVIFGVILSALVFAWEKGKQIQVEQKTNENGSKSYIFNGALFFGSATSFKQLFDVKNDPNHIVINLENMRIHDHSGIDALQHVIEKYKTANKHIYLHNISPECKKLLDKADNIIEITTIENINWHIATDKLA